MPVGGQKGNKNGMGKHVWSDAVRKALLLEDPTLPDQKRKITKLANKLIQMASKGDIQALKEIGDRVDGKPKAIVQHTGEGDGPIEVYQLTEKEMNDRIAVLLKGDGDE
jgi:hypothetical protein